MEQLLLWEVLVLFRAPMSATNTSWRSQVSSHFPYPLLALFLPSSCALPIISVPLLSRSSTLLLLQPVHGSAPDIMGKGIANPIACIRSGAMLLDRLGEPQKASRITQAVQKCLAERVFTPDLGGSATTRQVVDKIISSL